MLHIKFPWNRSAGSKKRILKGFYICGRGGHLGHVTSIMVKPGSSFEQTMMGRRCYIPSFVEIGPPVPEKKSFEGFYHIYGVAAIMVM